MDIREIQLEQVADKIKEFEVSKAPPVFELYAALVAISLSAMLFLLEGALSGNHLFHALMNALMPQYGWAFFLLMGGIISAVGMLLDSQIIRVIGLLVLLAAYGTVAAFYIVSFPNLGGVLMFWLATFTAASIPMVKYTGIRK